MYPFALGDHLRVNHGLYWHHGIYVGDGWVIHMSGVAAGKAAATVHWDRIEEFAGARGLASVEVVQYGVCDPAEVVFMRAQSQIDCGGYDVFRNNCEQFARWCKTGHFVSEQVESAKAAGFGVGGGAGATAAAVGIVAAGGAVAGTSGAGIMSGLAAVGGVVGAGAPAGVVMLAAAPSAVAVTAVRHAYRDDPALPVGERSARANARMAGAVSGIGATLATVGAISAAGVPGLSAAGIPSGLAAIGGTMLGGVVVAVAAPAAIAAGVAWLAHGLSR